MFQGYVKPRAKPSADVAKSEVTQEARPRDSPKKRKKEEEKAGKAVLESTIGSGAS